MSQQIISRPVPAQIAPKSRAVWIVGVAMAAVAVGVITWIAFSAAGSGEPRLNESTEVLARFVTSPTFDALPYEKQRQYYKVFDDRDKQVDQAFHDRRLTEPQYRAALEAAWLGKHINRVEKYFSLPPGQPRTDYIAGLLAKKNKKPGHDDHDNIEADESSAELRVDRWPQPLRDQWNQFHTVYKKEKKEAKAREAPSTRPHNARGTGK